MAVLVQRQESEAFPCSELRGSFRITLLWDTTPHVWAEEREVTM